MCGEGPLIGELPPLPLQDARTGKQGKTKRNETKEMLAFNVRLKGASRHGNVHGAKC